jgi:hypothetical protein
MPCYPRPRLADAPAADLFVGLGLGLGQTQQLDPALDRQKSTAAALHSDRLAASPP